MRFFKTSLVSRHKKIFLKQKNGSLKIQNKGPFSNLLIAYTHTYKKRDIIVKYFSKDSESKHVNMSYGKNVTPGPVRSEIPLATSGSVFLTTSHLLFYISPFHSPPLFNPLFSSLPLFIRSPFVCNILPGTFYTSIDSQILDTIYMKIRFSNSESLRRVKSMALTS